MSAPALPPLLRKVLIANRGEIACRVAATARRLGVATVAVYAHIDAQALHVQACDEALPLHANTPRAAYLDGAQLIACALRSGAQAIHPGYGFLSENADFAQACADAGLVFIGPPPAAIAAMGSKSQAKALMDQAGVPLVPGYHGAQQDSAHLAAQADAIGYPVLIKASAGGGGRGMRAVHQPGDFAAALASCQREALGSFGNAQVLIERLVARPRHIEVQVFADQHGHCVHLFERDCSVQRRHQKVLEEAPAPGLSEAVRTRLGQAAVAAARSVGYVGAGTVEFICEADVGHSGRFYFMEMNTRLQVEHPVTEAITGLDLVEWQLRVASGQPLPLAQDQIVCQGHAIEARLCAETPDAQFLPATGPIALWQMPAHTAFAPSPLRIDGGVRQGDAVGPDFDALLAKLITWGPDRATALARMAQALAHTHVAGLHTNTALLRRLVHTASFTQPVLDTDLIGREHHALFEAPGLPAHWAAAAWCAHQLAHEAQASTGTHPDAWPDPWSRHDAWCLHGAAVQQHSVRVNGERVAFTWAREHRPGQALAHRLSLCGQHWALRTQAMASSPAPGAGPAHVTLHLQALQTTPAPVHTERFALHGGTGPTAELHAFSLNQPAWHHSRIQAIDPLQQAAQADAPATAGRILATLPGRVVALWVQPGQSVKAHQPLLATEAMKMEHTLTAPRDGTVARILFAVGDQVAEGDELLQLQ